MGGSSSKAIAPGPCLSELKLRHGGGKTGDALIFPPEHAIFFPKTSPTNSFCLTLQIVNVYCSAWAASKAIRRGRAELKLVVATATIVEFGAANSVHFFK